MLGNTCWNANVIYMINRYVRLEIGKAGHESFIATFEQVRNKISAFPGCHGVVLWRGMGDRNIFATFSKWDSMEALNEYRSSELFNSTWTKVKPSFVARPQAFSYNISGQHD